MVFIQKPNLVDNNNNFQYTYSNQLKLFFRKISR